MTNTLSTHPATQFFDTHPAVCNGSPTVISDLAGDITPAIALAEITCAAIAARDARSPVSITIDPPDYAHPDAVLFDVPGHAYGAICGERTLFLDLTSGASTEDLNPDELGTLLADAGHRSGLEPAASRYALIDASGHHPRDLASIPAFAAAVRRDGEIGAVLRHAQAFTDCLRDVPTSICLPRLSLTRTDRGEPFAAIIDGDEVIAGVSSNGVVAVPSSWFGNARPLAGASLAADVARPLQRWRALLAE